MARAKISKTLTRGKAPKPKMSRAGARAVDDKYYGAEPLIVDCNHETAYRDALNWYNYMHDNDQSRDWLLDYMKKVGFQKTQIAAVKRCPKFRVPTTIGWQARMMINGNTLTESSMNFFNNKLDELFALSTTIKEVSEEVIVKSTVSIQERTIAKSNQIITDCEEAIDRDPQLNIYEWLKGIEATVSAANAIKSYYSRWKEDYEPEEGDSRATLRIKQSQYNYWSTFIEDIDRYCGNAKSVKVRKPREKKQKTAVDQVKTLKYQKEFPSLKIVSVNPAEIIGSNQLWLYNTKYRKLTRLDAMGPSGLQVKGTTVTGYDIEKSLTKSVRKPEVTTHAVLTAGKINLRRLMDDIKTNQTEPNGRINNDTIILRVCK